MSIWKAILSFPSPSTNSWFTITVFPAWWHMWLSCCKFPIWTPVSCIQRLSDCIAFFKYFTSFTDGIILKLLVFFSLFVLNYEKLDNKIFLLFFDLTIKQKFMIYKEEIWYHFGLTRMDYLFFGIGNSCLTPWTLIL